MKNLILIEAAQQWSSILRIGELGSDQAILLMTNEIS